jgi:ubiquinone/menaquinone biosynthesis C-methylase UbiE
MLSSLLRLFFHHLYTSLAWTYDWVALSTSMGQWFEWQKAALDALPEGRILEVGVGTGHLMLEMETIGMNAWGVDASRQMAHLSAHRLASHTVEPRVIQARAQALPFAGNSFAGVVSTFPSEYIMQPDTLHQIHRCLAPGGRAVVLPMARITGKSWYDRIADWLYRFTGQSGPVEAGWTKPFELSGMLAQVEVVSQPRADVVRIVVEKPSLGTETKHRAGRLA